MRSNERRRLYKELQGRPNGGPPGHGGEGQSMWREHVDSGANTAERGVVAGAGSPGARVMGTGLLTVEIPLGPQCVCPATADAWLAWVRQLRGAPWPREEGVLSARAAASRAGPLGQVAMRASEEDCRRTAWLGRTSEQPWRARPGACPGVCSEEGAWPVEERSYRRLLAGSLECWCIGLWSLEGHAATLQSGA